MRKEEFNNQLLADEAFDETSVVTQLLEKDRKSSLIYYLCRSFYLLVYNANIVRTENNTYECYISDDSLIPAASELNDAINYLSETFQVDRESVKNDLFFVINKYYTDTAYQKELQNQFSIIQSDTERFMSEFGTLYELNHFPNWDRFEQRVRSFV
ncbi:hypothetical protein [Salipaludibacillus daqingensis]|uniref:hypothetical protein n=1 Tax=Salipaludibacillus daqingensis TaxID=3041001 RepID=UPI0024760B84|nr:hypothetical protein [Salipaludibacillus daqingensis]